MDAGKPQFARRQGLLTGLVCAVVVLCVPALSHAVPTDWLIPAGDGQCYDGTPEQSPAAHRLGLSAPAFADESEPVEQEGPCSVASEVDGADASSALCFEAAGAQISTIPELLASARGREMAGDIARNVQAKLAELRAEAEPIAFSDPEQFPSDDPEDGKVSCTTHPAECHSLPPAPSPVQLDSTLPHADAHLLGLKLDHLPEPPQMRPLPDTDLGPSAGYRELPDPPPRHV